MEQRRAVYYYFRDGDPLPAPAPKGQEPLHSYAPCQICKAPVCTEEDTCPGVELASARGGWVCSRKCWNIAAAEAEGGWTPPPSGTPEKACHVLGFCPRWPLVGVCGLCAFPLAHPVHAAPQETRSE